MMNGSETKNNRGFTVIETLVAISILMIAVGAPLTIVQESLSAALLAKDQVVASYLAQDATEYIRSTRDGNDGFAWDRYLDTCVGGTACKIDTTNNDPSTAITTCGGTCPAMRFKDDATRGYFNYGSGNPAEKNDQRFTRTITATQVNSRELEFVIEVEWSVGLTTKKVEITEHIHDWRS